MHPVALFPFENSLVYHTSSGYIECCAVCVFSPRADVWNVVRTLPWEKNIPLFSDLHKLSADYLVHRCFLHESIFLWLVIHHLIYLILILLHPYSLRSHMSPIFTSPSLLFVCLSSDILDVKRALWAPTAERGLSVGMQARKHKQQKGTQKHDLINWFEQDPSGRSKSEGHESKGPVSAFQRRLRDSRYLCAQRRGLCKVGHKTPS